MATSPENTSMAVFCDFENVALGVRDANYEKFDIKLVLERLLLKGSIVVKKAYCDWERYKGFKGTMHEANFELIEIPHLRMSGKNSADIRLVVDALDLCYTKAHVNTFVIVSGDSDFSPLVSKLRENAKQVIGVGVKQSTSDLLIANCDEFIFYDDLVRETRRSAAKRERNPSETANAPRRTPEEEQRRREDLEKRRTQAIEIALETFEALIAERGDSGKIWASVLKQAIKRRKPDFNESYYGFRTFGNLIEEAQSRGLLESGRDEKSNTYVCRASGSNGSSNGVSNGGSSLERPATTPPDAGTSGTATSHDSHGIPEPILESLPPPSSSESSTTGGAATVETCAEEPSPTTTTKRKGHGARRPARQTAKEAKQPREPGHLDTTRAEPTPLATPLTPLPIPAKPARGPAAATVVTAASQPAAAEITEVPVAKLASASESASTPESSKPAPGKGTAAKKQPSSQPRRPRKTAETIPSKEGS